jgi:hypothetical protein
MRRMLIENYFYAINTLIPREGSLDFFTRKNFN